MRRRRRGAPLGGPIHVDPNYPPNGTGHNYYDLRTQGTNLKSYAAFGEVYYDFTPQLKLTLGGRYTVDQLASISTRSPCCRRRRTTDRPSRTLVPDLAVSAGRARRLPERRSRVAHPGGRRLPGRFLHDLDAACLITERVTYREFTGRANLTWTPTLSFTDKTLFYAQYSRGYKGGGFNTACQARSAAPAAAPRRAAIRSATIRSSSTPTKSAPRIRCSAARPS